MEGDGNKQQQVRELKSTGSLLGLVIVIAIALIQYYIFTEISGNSTLLPSYDSFIAKIMDGDIISKFLWIIKDFSEGQFFGGIISGFGVITGGIIACILDRKKSKYRGFDIVFGLNIFPWILASQILTSVFSVFVLKYLNFIDGDLVSWAPTFLLLVGVPQAVLCIFGPSIKNLIVGSLLGAFLSVPIANFVGYKIMNIIDMPTNIANYIALALSITLGLQVCKLLPWIKEKPFPLIKENQRNLSYDEKYKLLKSPLFLVRRTLADFTDCLFYGNEWATIFLILGAVVDWLINSTHGLAGARLFPAVLLSQLVSGGIGVFLYGYNHIEKGWYPTYVPVVSIGPFCVLTFGGSLHVALFAAVIGGIIGAPFAGLLNTYLPKHLHGVIANVLAMAITTITVITVMNALPWF